VYRRRAEPPGLRSPGLRSPGRRPLGYARWPELAIRRYFRASLCGDAGTQRWSGCRAWDVGCEIGRSKTAYGYGRLPVTPGEDGVVIDLRETGRDRDGAAGRGIGRGVRPAARGVRRTRRGERRRRRDRRRREPTRTRRPTSWPRSRPAGGEAVAHRGDVGEPAVGDALVARALDSWGRLDAVINNAGLRPPAHGVST